MTEEFNEENSTSKEDNTGLDGNVEKEQTGPGDTRGPEQTGPGDTRGPEQTGPGDTSGSEQTGNDIPEPELTGGSGSAETEMTSDGEKKKIDFLFFTGLSRLILYFAGGLAIFFAAAIFVLSLRQQSARHFQMPDLVGKYYIGAHNELMNSELRVRLVLKNYPDLASGLVLYQSVPAGSLISPRDKLYLVVNQTEVLFNMPRLTGNTIQTARASLSRFTHQGNTYSLEIGAVSQIESDSPKDVVLAQFPPPAIKISPEQKVYLLVSAGPGSKAGAMGKLNPTALLNQNLVIAADLLRRRGEEYRLSFAQNGGPGSDTGRILEVSRNDRGIYNLKVGYRKTGAKYPNGYERVALNLTGGACRAEVVDKEKGSKNGAAKRVIFSSQKHEEGEKVELLFYRIGTEVLTVTCGAETIYDQLFTPDDFS